jgi:hypothetical protein
LSLGKTTLFPQWLPEFISLKNQETKSSTAGKEIDAVWFGLEGSNLLERLAC